MNQVASWLKSAQIRRILTVYLSGLILFVSVIFGQLSYTQQAIAAPQTSQAKNSQVNQTNTQNRANLQQAKEDTKDSEGGLFENIKEKLNLDEPLPESTKDFFKQVQGEDVQVEEPRPSGKGHEAIE